MATKTTVLLEDDLSGGAADETVSFALDGRAFEIDLAAKNADKLTEGSRPIRECWPASGKARSDRSQDPDPEWIFRRSDCDAEMGNRKRLRGERAWSHSRLYPRGVPLGVVEVSA